MASKLDVSHTTLAMYKRGERLPEIEFLARFSELTGEDFPTLVRLRLEEAGDQGSYVLDIYKDMFSGLTVADPGIYGHSDPNVDWEVLEHVVTDVESSVSPSAMSPKRKARLICRLYKYYLNRMGADGLAASDRKMMGEILRAAIEQEDDS